MSNGLAIATVTQALALLVANNLRPEIDIAVSVETRKPPAEPPPDPTVTIFLYQVTPNASMRHHDLPTRASDGTLLKRPAAPLDLHYLISAYGDEIELVGQRLIGSVVRTLHEIPVLPKELIAEAAEKPYLAGSDLAESIQRVRFTPTQMDIDETSKLWGMLHQTPYALSVCYQGALVFVEGREQPVPPKPVRERTVRVAPFGAPGAPERPELPTSAEAGSPVAAAVPGGSATAAATAPAPVNGRGAANGTGPAAGGRAGGRSATGTGGAGAGGTGTGAAAGAARSAGSAAAEPAGKPAAEPSAESAAESASAEPSPAKKRATAAKAAAKTTESSTAASRTRKAAGAARGGTRRGGTAAGKKQAAGKDGGSGTGGEPGGADDTGRSGTSGRSGGSGGSGKSGDKEA